MSPSLFDAHVLTRSQWAFETVPSFHPDAEPTLPHARTDPAAPAAFVHDGEVEVIELVATLPHGTPDTDDEFFPADLSGQTHAIRPELALEVTDDAPQAARARPRVRPPVRPGDGAGAGARNARRLLPLLAGTATLVLTLVLAAPVVLPGLVVRDMRGELELVGVAVALRDAHDADEATPARDSEVCVEQPAGHDTLLATKCTASLGVAVPDYGVGRLKVGNRYAVVDFDVQHGRAGLSIVYSVRTPQGVVRIPPSLTRWRHPSGERVTERSPLQPWVQVASGIWPS
jgi:hypothetical protein